MDSKQASRITGGNSAYGRNASDFYPTPPEATKALLDFLALEPETMIWEPACGEGHMALVMQAMGHTVIGTDIRQTGTDFLTAELPSESVDWIITNPPFSLAEQFIRRCAVHKRPFALLLKSQYWHAKSRFELFQEIPPAYVLPLTWRPDFLFQTRGKGSPLMDVMWCVWEPGHDGTKFLPLKKPVMEES